MMVRLKEAIKSTNIWKDILYPVRSRKQMLDWEKQGRPSPPPHSVKVRNILCLADLFGIDVLIETGTYRGDMIDATKNRFHRVISIELFEPFVRNARERFRNDKNVEIVHGDSGVLLPQILQRVEAPAVFWLDGHFSGTGTGKGHLETPVVAELAAIRAGRQEIRDVIIIDDARLFGSEPDYPKLDEFLAAIREQFERPVIVANDSIFILPR